MNLDRRTLLSTSSALLRVHNRKVTAPAFSRFLSTHVTNLACEDHEPGFLGSVETYFDRVSLPFLLCFNGHMKLKRGEEETGEEGTELLFFMRILFES